MPWSLEQALFGTKKAPANDAPSVGVGKIGTPTARPPYPATDPHTLVRAFTQNELSYACIDIRASSAGDPTLEVQQRQADGSYTAIPGHPLRRLLIRPNDHQDEASFMRACVASMDIAGVLYCERLVSASGGLVGLNPLNPASVRAMDLGQGLFYRWHEHGAQIDFRPDELLIRRADWTRPARMAVALSTIDGDSAQTDYVRSFFNNGGVPSGRIKVKGTLTTDQAEGIRNRWRSMFSRYGRQHDVAVFDDNGDYEKIGSNLDELESAIVRGVSESRICMAFQVPPLIIYSYFGLTRATYSNMDAAMRGFWQNTMSPLLKEWRAFFTWSLLAEFEGTDRILGEQVRLFWNTELVSALQADEDMVAKRAELAWRSGATTRAEYRASLGMSVDPIADAFYLLPTGQIIPAGALPSAPTPPPAPVIVAPPPPPDPAGIKSNGHIKEYVNGRS